jgi:spermidine synthase
VTGAADPGISRLRIFWLLAATFLVSIAGIFYELVIATSSTFLIGDSVRQFSFVIGLFLTSMGLGAWASRYVGTARVGFIWGQMALALIGGASAPLLFLVYAYLGTTSALLLVLIIATGALSGMEIPLIVRMLNELGAAKFRFENVLSLDYVGALVASILFPIVIVPLLGLISSSLLFGTLNLAIAGITLLVFWDSVSRAMQGFWLFAAVILVGGLMNTDRLVALSDAAIFDDDIVYSETTPYQKIIVTRFRDRYRLYLNNGIQFDSLDEHRYHELLVHPAILGSARADRVLILGGGDWQRAKSSSTRPSKALIWLTLIPPSQTCFPPISACANSAVTP